MTDQIIRFIAPAIVAMSVGAALFAFIVTFIEVVVVVMRWLKTLVQATFFKTNP